MSALHRILSGLLAATLLVQPAFALGGCCCTESTAADPIASQSEDQLAVSAQCPNCRTAAAQESSSRDQTGSLQSDGCGCSNHQRVLPATVSNNRQVAFEVAAQVLWVQTTFVSQPDVRRIETSTDTPPWPHVPINVMLCRWLA